MNDKQRKRILRHLEEHRDREQNKELRKAAKIRRAGQDTRQRRRRFDADDADVEAFEKIARPRAVPQRPAPVHEHRAGVISRPDPQDPDRELVLATGVDIGVVVVRPQEGSVRTGVIDRFLLIVERGDVRPLICVNKIDLCDGDARRTLAAQLAPYAAIAVPHVLCSATTGAGIDALRAHLRGRACVFVGHSGVGKTSLMNALDPSTERRTSAVRDHDGKGRHTTTRATVTELGDGTRLIDTPGVRQIGLWQLARTELGAWFPDLAPHAARCRFRDCTHDHEPDCAVRTAAADGAIAAARYATYRRLLADLPAIE